MYRYFFLSLFYFFASILPVQAHSKENKTVILWGSDANSGAPFVFRNPQNPSEIIGFDADIAEAIANEMGLKSQFVQNTWDGLIPGLQAKNYDMVLDGLEISRDRTQNITFSMPYYITFERITVTAANHTINNAHDLSGKKVGTLPSSLAQKILQGMHNVDIRYYPEEVNAFEDLLVNSRIDAVLLDDAITKYYAAPNPKLKVLDDHVGRFSYGVGLRNDDPEFANQVNTALQSLIDSGKMKLILEKWGLWNQETAQEWGQSEKITSPPTAYEHFLTSTGHNKTFKDKVVQYIGFVPLLAKGAITTLEISILSMVLAMILGLFVALMRLYAPKFISKLALLYVEIIRGTPLLIQLYLIFYGLPLIGIHFTPFISAVLGLGLNYSASEAENYRAGILSVPRNQMDAALALGMTRSHSLKHIILPQAIRLVLPPVTNDFIALIKDSSLVSVITLVELTTVYSQLATTYFDYLGIGLLAAAMYLVIGLPFARLSRYVEKRYSLYYRGSSARQSKFPSIQQNTQN